MTALVDTWGHTRRRALAGAKSLGAILTIVGAIFLVIVVVIFVLIGVLQAWTGPFGDSWLSMWEHSLQPMRYFPLAMGVMLAAGAFPAFVSYGLTRREFSLAGSVVILGTGVVVAAAGTTGLALESAIFDWAGHSQTFEFAHLYTGAGDVVAVFGEYLLLSVAHMAAGWTMGVTYYRFGGWIGTALLPLTVVPALGVELLLMVSWVGNVVADGWGVGRLPNALAIPLSVAVIIATLVMNHLLIRRMAIK